MKITTKAHYGLMAMCELGRRYGAAPTCVREIAALQRCSESYMEQLFSLLKKAGLIQSVRGARGGYTLTRDPAQITAGEIIRALEGPIGFTDCSCDSADSSCALEADCSSGRFWKELYRVIDTFLEDRKLSEFIKQSSCK